MLGKYLNPQNDVAFKRIFGTEKNKDILIAMLNAVLQEQLHRPIKEVSFINPIQDADTVTAKTSIVDVLCTDQGGCQYIIEMQVAKHQAFTKRSQYYASKAYSRQLSSGESYEELQKVIFLAFLSETVFPHKKDHKSNHATMDVKTLDKDLDGVLYTFVELDKFQVPEGKKLSALSLEERFYLFLKHASDMSQEDFGELTKDSPVITHAFQELSATFWSEEEIASYERIEKKLMDAHNFVAEARKEGLQEGMEKGKIVGLKEGKIVIAKQMLTKGMDIRLICDLTGLSAEEVQALRVLR